MPANTNYRIKLYYVPLILAGIILIGVLFVIRSGDRQPGALLYEAHCQNCHQDDGTGLKALIPPLKSADWLAYNQDTLACIIRHGMDGPMTVNGKFFDEKMPANEQLTEGQIMNIINFINNEWGNDYGRQSLRDVQQSLEDCAH